MRRIAILLSTLTLAASALVSPVAAAETPDLIPLPVGFHPEGIAVRSDGTFYVGSLVDGAIFRGDVRTGSGDVWVAGTPGRVAVGLSQDEPAGRLFVAGGPTGGGAVYDDETGELLAEYSFGGGFVNDVIVTRNAAYFTDSFAPVLYILPFGPGRTLPAADGTESLTLTGDFQFDPSTFNSNGIEASADGATLIVCNSAFGALYAVDATSGVASEIDLGQAAVPNCDGLVRKGRALFVVQNFLNQISAIRLAPDLSRGVVMSVITSDAFRIPTTVDTFGKSLYVVNSRFDVAPPPFGTPPVEVEFEIVRVDRR